MWAILGKTSVYYTALFIFRLRSDSFFLFDFHDTATVIYMRHRRKILSYQVTTERQIRRFQVGRRGERKGMKRRGQQFVFLVWMYTIVSGRCDRYMHQKFMTLCMMHSVNKQVWFWFPLSGDRAQHTSNRGARSDTWIPNRRLGSRLLILFLFLYSFQKMLLISSWNFKILYFFFSS